MLIRNNLVNLLNKNLSTPMYYLLYAFVWLIAWLPLRLLYLFSDVFFLILYFLTGYRKNVVRENLKNSFPHKSEKERRKLERCFYRYLCDLTVETIKLMHISKKEMNKRMKYLNPELIAQEYAKGKSIMLMTSHCGNWEWTSSFSQFFPDKPVYQIYRRLKNKKMDQFVYTLRTRFGAKNIEKSKILREMLRLRNESKIVMFGMLSDQTPSPANIHYRTVFLNQNTPVLTGTEQLAKKFNYPVLFAAVSRKKRGYYECEFIPISLNPRETEEFEITEKYTRLLEQKIEQEPAYWLWSHKRWKHK